MLSLFRTNQAYAGLLLFVYALVLWLPLFFFPVAPVEGAAGDGVMGAWLTGLLTGHPYAAILVTVGLVGVQGIQINTWATRHNLSRSVTQFPGLFLVLVSALVYQFHGFSAFQAANVFLLFSLISLGRLYKREEPAVALFNAGAWLGLASLFRPEYLLFLPACVAVVSILRSLELRSVLQIVTGAGLIYFFVAVTGYLTGGFYDYFGQQLGAFGLPDLLPMASRDLPGLVALALLIVGVILGYGRISLLLNIEGSKNTGVLAWFLLFSILVVAVTDGVSVANAQVLVIPLGALLGLGMVNVKPSTAGAIHLLLVVVAMVPLFVSW